MDRVIDFMDFPIKFWGASPRRFPARFPVVSTDFIRGKTHWMRHAFTSCNFSVILRGGGAFHRNGMVWPVVAPCVITQWPEEFVEYGPCGEHTSWDECYVIYDRAAYSELMACGFIHPDRPVWPVVNPSAVHVLVGELHTLSLAVMPHEIADRVDRVWERILLETLLGRQPEDDAPRQIQSVVTGIHSHPGKAFDPAAVAASLGMSVPTFRRKWHQHVGIPPARYLQEVRLRAACRLLVETRKPVKAIAHLVGYEDEFHFSRRFRAAHGRSPRDYRRAFGLHSIP
jgi:AraC-like DNA-binding protein